MHCGPLPQKVMCPKRHLTLMSLESLGEFAQIPLNPDGSLPVTQAMCEACRQEIKVVETQPAFQVGDIILHK